MSIQSEIERISTNVQNTISTIADTGVSVASDANSDDLPALAAALANEKLSKSGGTITGNILFDNSASAQSGEPNLKWGTRGSNTPYIGFASDQTDGTFLLGSLKGTAYSTGLAIGGGSGNLLWKGSKVAVTSDIPAAYTHPTTSGNKHIPSGGSSGQILRWSADGTAVWGADNNTTYSAATTSAAGLMSAADKTKLNGIATGANAYSLPTASSSTLGGVKTTSTVTSNTGYTACPIIDGVPYYKDTNTTYSNIPKTTTITASATVSANTETAISISYSGFAGTILLTFFCGITASNSSSQVTKAVPTYSTLGRVDRVRVLSTSAQTVNVCIGVIYQ